MHITCKLVESGQELKDARNIRKEVFVIEQSVPESLEWDEFEQSALHMVCKLDEKVIGTGRLSFLGESGDEAKVERVAVLKDYRKQGVGTAIVRFMVELAKKKDARVIYANVQLTAQEFYSKLGFQPVGNKFYEAGIEHIKMLL